VATTQYLSYAMKQPKILLLVVIALLPLTLVSCAPWGTQSAGGWSGTAFHDGIVYVGIDGRVVAINATSRELQWSHPIVAEGSSGMSCGQSSVSAAIYTTPIVDADLVYVGSYTSNGGRVYALSINDGQIIWEYPKGGAHIGTIVGSPVIANEIIYVGSSDSAIYALDTNRNGVEEWKAEILDEKGKKHEKLWNSPVIQGNTLYISTFDGHIYALSVETGELLDWSFEAEAGFASSPLIYEDIIYVGSFDRHLYAVKIGSDVPLWKFPREKSAGNWFWASSIVNEGIVYAGCLDGKLYAIEAKTGEKLWEFDAESPIVSSPVLMDDLLVVAAESGNVYVINPETGVGERIKNRENSDKPTIDAQIRAPLCAHEGLIYVRDEDNQLYIVDIGNKEVSHPISLTKKE